MLPQINVTCGVVHARQGLPLRQDAQTIFMIQCTLELL